jgi:hypothetical protein
MLQFVTDAVRFAKKPEPGKDSDMRRIIINPSGNQQKDLFQDMVIDFVLGFLGLLGISLTTGWVLRYLIGAPLTDPINPLLIMLGIATLVTMIRIHRETAMPGEGNLWMTRRTYVGTVFHVLISAYVIYLMGVAFDIPFFRAIPEWIYNSLTRLLF